MDRFNGTVVPLPPPTAPAVASSYTAGMYQQTSASTPIYQASIYEAETVNHQSPLFKGLPSGLQKAMLAHKANTAAAFRVLDNSGSMTVSDGALLNRGNGKTTQVSRFAELKDAELEQAQLAATFGISTQFRLLNEADYRTGQIADVSSEADVQQVRQLLKDRPTGITPLTEHLHDIANQIREKMGHDQKHYHGPKFNITLITDGLPNSHGYGDQGDQQRFIQALTEVLQLPTNVVIRLCTNESDVVDFYNDLDGALKPGVQASSYNPNAELNLEVIDDHLGEAQEIRKTNPWINYGRQLHMVRTAGLTNKVFDYIDERRLSAEEARDFCALVYGLDEPPNPRTDWKGFADQMNQAIKNEPTTTDPLRREKEKPFVSMNKLRSAYKPGFF